MMEESDKTASFMSFSTKKLVAVEFPGYIRSKKNMLSTMGGEEGISDAYYNKKCRLQMTYRPQDLFAHHMCADLTPCTGLFMKVRRRKKLDGTYEYQQEIVGSVRQMYKFQTLMDYQVVTPEPLRNYYGNIRGSELGQNEFPMHCLPSVFGRIDIAGSYYYKPNPELKQVSFTKEMKNNVSNEGDGDTKGTARKRRQTESQAALFDCEDIVYQPSQKSLSDLKILEDGDDKKEIEKLKKMFEERPIWSKAALMCHVNLSAERYKKVLPGIAYYWLNGPWRCLWCRMGYDPRKDPAARKYQLLEVRIRNIKEGGFNFVHLIPKRSCLNYIPRNLQARVSAQGSNVLAINSSDDTVDQNRDMFPYIFTTTKPIYTRYMMYQLCDLYEDNVQRIINAPTEVKVCSAKDGWFAEGVLGQLRVFVVQAAGNYFKRQQAEEVKTETESVVSNENFEDEEYENEQILNEMGDEYFGGENFSYLQMLNDDNIMF